VPQISAMFTSNLNLGKKEFAWPFHSPALSGAMHSSTKKELIQQSLARVLGPWVRF